MFRKFRKYDSESRGFARFHRFANIFPRSFTFRVVWQDSQDFANTSFERFPNSQFRKNSQIGFSFRKFRNVFATGKAEQTARHDVHAKYAHPTLLMPNDDPTLRGT